jgi:hypothetical protein
MPFFVSRRDYTTGICDRKVTAAKIKLFFVVALLSVSQFEVSLAIVPKRDILFGRVFPRLAALFEVLANLLINVISFFWDELHAEKSIPVIVVLFQIAAAFGTSIEA